MHHATTKVPINIIETLSEREYEILSLMVKGLGTLEIANNLDLQMGTVSTYKKRIYCKLKQKFPRYHYNLSEIRFIVVSSWFGIDSSKSGTIPKSNPKTIYEN